MRLHIIKFNLLTKFIFYLLFLASCNAVAIDDSDFVSKSNQMSKIYYMEDFNSNKKNICDAVDYKLIHKWDSTHSQGKYIDNYISKNSLLKSIPLYGDTRLIGGQRQLDIVSDNNGLPLFMVRGYLSDILCVDLTNDKNAELYIEVNPRGGNAGFDFVVLANDINGNLTPIYKRNGITKFIDINFDGIKEAIWVTGSLVDGYEYHADCFKGGIYQKCSANYNESYLNKMFEEANFLGKVLN